MRLVTGGGKSKHFGGEGVGAMSPSIVVWVIINNKIKIIAKKKKNSLKIKIKCTWIYFLIISGCDDIFCNRYMPDYGRRQHQLKYNKHNKDKDSDTDPNDK